MINQNYFYSARIFFTAKHSLSIKTALLCGLILLMFQAILSAQVRQVPADYPTIQAAINAAQVGDTVLVSPGTYFENLQLTGRDIVLTSRFWLDQNPHLIEQTIVDGSQPVHSDTASCLLIWKHETAATVVEGFTFRGGRGTIWYDPAGAGTFREGGGILTEFSSPIIRHNIIRDNIIPSGGAGLVSSGGGGIRCGEGSPRIENNRIIYNRGDGYGGGVVLNFCPNVVVRNNIIAHNSGGKDFSGGGFWSTGQDQNSVVTLENNVIAYNHALAGTGQFAGKGGGVWTFSIKIKMRNNIVWGNTQSGKQINQAGAATEIRYNCIQDGFAGIGNITANPLFADTICFLLSPGSPCTDAGEPIAASEDFSENGKNAVYPARGVLRNDIGAYGGPGRGVLGCFRAFAPAGKFTKVLNSPVVTTPGDSRSVNWIDVDGDKDLDLMITNGPQAGENNFLYKNGGQGQFTLVTDDPIVQDGTPSDGATWADFDNDGDNDCFVANWWGIPNLLYKNTGNGTFERITTGSLVTGSSYSETASWGDYDNDGFVDLYVNNSDGDNKNFLYHNLGNGTFEKITTGSPVTDALVSRCVNWTDYDDDGDVDIFVTNENNQNENLYQNNNGTFTKITGGPLLTNGGSTMSASWGDYDNDGLQDVFLANDQANDALFHNDGQGNFTKITTGPVVTSGGNSFGSEWADVDNDGDLDLFVTHAFNGGPWRNFLFRNKGNSIFERDLTEVVATDEGWSYGAAFGDFDRDGDLDLAVANCLNASQPDYLYENHAAETTNRWLVVDCIGTTSNRSAIGAKVRVKSTIDGQSVTQMREISAQSGYCGQNQLAPHFGLGNAETIESITVEWPSGLEEIFGNVAVNQYVTLTEGQGISSVKTPKGATGLALYPPTPNPFHDSVDYRFDLLKTAVLKIEVRDLQGKTIRHLAEGKFEAGSHHLHWDGKMTNGSNVPAGQYILVFQQDGQVAAQVMVKI